MSDIKPTIKVNVDNYVRAETSRQFSRMIKMADGLNKFSHGRKLVPLNKQAIVRMNRDTLYSSALVNLSAGAQLTLPKTNGRYLSVVIINEDNYTTEIFHHQGTYQLTELQHGSPFVAVIVRILVDPNDPADLKQANALQDSIEITAHCHSPYQPQQYDRDSLKTTHKLLQQLGEGLSDADKCNGKQDEVDQTRHLLNTAFGWGGLPTYEVVYQVSNTPLSTRHHQLTVDSVPVDGFWSISIYNKQGYFEDNIYNSNSINSVTAKPNSDGSYSINFGPSNEHKLNYLYIMEGWSYVVRLYQPHKAAQKGLWRFPEPTPTR